MPKSGTTESCNSFMFTSSISSCWVIFVNPDQKIEMLFYLPLSYIISPHWKTQKWGPWSNSKRLTTWRSWTDGSWSTLCGRQIKIKKKYSINGHIAIPKTMLCHLSNQKFPGSFTWAMHPMVLSRYNRGKHKELWDLTL